MGINLVREEEKIVYNMGDSKIFYRRIPAIRRTLVIKKHTRKGQVNWAEVAAELLEYAVTGWENVRDGETEVKFSAELLGRLPEDVRGDLMELTGAAAAESLETGRGNSKGGSSGT